MTDTTSRQPNMCDCELGHNGLGIMGRECDCPANATLSADSEAPALLPCPFCGQVPSLVQALPSGWAVSCAGCGVGSGIRYSLMEDARPLVAEQWNRRADLARPSQAGDERVAREAGRAEGWAEAAGFLETLKGADLDGNEFDLPADEWRVAVLMGVRACADKLAALAAMDTPKGGGDA